MLTCCRRAELAPQGSTPTVSSSFLRKLRAFDSGLELVWNPWLRHWTLFRVIDRGAASCDDLLYKELSLCGPHNEYRMLGDWVFDVLREKSLLRLDPDPDRGGRALDDHLRKQDEKVEKKWNDRASEIDENMNKDYQLAKVGKTVEHGDGEFIPMDRPGSGKKRIYGHETSKQRKTVI